MPHPVHSLLQRFLDTQQYAFDPRERALFERPAPQGPKTAPERVTKKGVYGELGHQS